jgi:hypothetical protein
MQALLAFRNRSRSAEQGECQLGRGLPASRPFRGRSARKSLAASADVRRRARRPTRGQAQRGRIESLGLITKKGDDARRRRENKIDDDSEELCERVATGDAAVDAAIMRGMRGSLCVTKGSAVRVSRLHNRRNGRAVVARRRAVARDGEALQQKQTCDRARGEGAHAGPEESLLCLHFAMNDPRAFARQWSSLRSVRILQRCCSLDTDAGCRAHESIVGSEVRRHYLRDLSHSAIAGSSREPATVTSLPSAPTIAVKGSSPRHVGSTSKKSLSRKSSAKPY